MSVIARWETAPHWTGLRFKIAEAPDVQILLTSTGPGPLGHGMRGLDDFVTDKPTLFATVTLYAGWHDVTGCVDQAAFERFATHA